MIIKRNIAEQLDEMFGLTDEPFYKIMIQYTYYNDNELSNFINENLNLCVAYLNPLTKKFVTIY